MNYNRVVETTENVSDYEKTTSEWRNLFFQPLLEKVFIRCSTYFFKIHQIFIKVKDTNHLI